MSFLRGLFDRPLSQRDFARLAARELARHEPGDEAIEIDDVVFALKMGPSTAYLANIYRTYVAAPRAERAPLLQHWAQASAADARFRMPASYEGARDHVMPMLRPIEEDDLLGFAPDAFVDRPFSNDLVLSVVYDLPQSVKRLPRSQLETWDVDADTVWAQALHNLRLRSGDEWHRLADGLFQSRWNDAYDATRVVFPDLLHRTGVAGRPIGMVPERNVLLVTGDRETLPLDRFVAAGLGVYDASPYARSPVPYVLDGERLVPLDLPADLQRLIDFRQMGRTAAAANEQKRTLEDAHPDFFFATLMVVRPDDDTWQRSLVTWPPTPTLLPRADLIAFSEANVTVAWRDVESVIGPLPEDPRFRPARFIARELPDAAQMARIAAAAIDLRAAFEGRAAPP